MGRFDARIAVITGAAQGIGFGTATRFAEEGASVAILDLDEGAAAAAAAKLPTSDGASHIGIGCDVADSAAAGAAVERVVAELGGIHVLINNAGVTRDNLLFKMTEDDWDMVMAVHLRGAFNTAKSASKYMTEQKYGKIVNLSSRSALGNRGQANYSAAKAGIIGFTSTLALELGKFNINVNAVAPGFIETPMTDSTAARVGVDKEDFKKGAAAATPLGRVGQPIDIANVVAFFASDESSFVTGQTLHVNGGR